MKGNDREVLVTGGLGFLGRHVVEALQDVGLAPVVLDRVKAAPELRSVQADLVEDPPDLGSFETQMVFHLAGLAHVVPQNKETAQHFFDVNVGGTRNLLKALDKCSRIPEALVLVSTVAVYGVESGESLDEETPRRAADPYGVSKREQEDVILDWGRRRNVRVGIVRLPLVAGRGAPGNFGAMVRALKAGWYPGIGNGDARRSIVLAGDVARILPKVAGIGGVFHLTDGYHPSFREIEEALCSALGRKSPRRIPLSVARVMAWGGDFLQNISGRTMPFSTRTLGKITSALTFSDRKARELLGWAPRPVLDAVEEIVR